MMKDRIDKRMMKRNGGVSSKTRARNKETNRRVCFVLHISKGKSRRRKKIDRIKKNEAKSKIKKKIFVFFFLRKKGNTKTKIVSCHRFESSSSFVVVNTLFLSAMG